jgi:Divergent InlB B-repeat domain
VAANEAIHPSHGDGRSPLRSGIAMLSCILMALTSLVVAATDARAATPELLLGQNKVGEYQPVRGDTYLAWQQNTRQHPSHYDVFARPMAGGEKFKVNARQTQGANGGIDGDTLVYQQFKGKRSDLKFFDLGTRTRTPPPAGVNTDQWEYWPSVSGDWLLFARLYGNDARRIFLFDLSTGDSRRLDGVRGAGSDLAPGQVSGDWAVWSKCRQGGCDVIRYHIPDGTRETIPNNGTRQHAPSVDPDGTVFFARANARCGGSVKLIRRPLQGGETVLWRISSGDDIGTTRTFVDPNGVTTVLFDQFDCDQATGSDAWAMGEDFTPGLTVTLSGDASGTVTSSPAGINCGNDCTESYASGTGVTLTAAPAQGASFAGWSGACTGSNTTCTLTINGARSVTATFTTKPVLTVDNLANAQGSVSSTPAGIDCGNDCNQPFDQGISVTLKANPNATSTFGGWSGCTVTGPLTCTVTMDASKTVTATFSLKPLLTVEISPSGDGTGAISAPGIACEPDCSEQYDLGTDVTLMADPEPDTTIVSWSGCDSVGVNSCMVDMTGNKTVTATFDDPLV